MSTQLIFGNDLDVLADCLIEKLAKERSEGGWLSALEPVTIVVPSDPIRQFLKLRMAEQKGIAANVKMPFLNEWLDEHLHALLSQSGQTNLRLLGRTQILSLLLGFFITDSLDDASLKPIKNYLGVREGGDAYLRRVYQLAERLAALFDEYALSRPDMLNAWRNGKDYTALDYQEWLQTEQWQAALWRKVFGEDGFAEQCRKLGSKGAVEGEKPERWLFRDELLNSLESFDLKPATNQAVESTYLFGFHHLGGSFPRLLKLVAKALPLHIFVPSPCKEEPASFSFESKDEGATLHERWARPGRENISILHRDLAPASSIADFSTPRGNEFLKTLQNDIVLRRSEDEITKTSLDIGDRSLQFFSCPGLRREVEIIADEIWALIANSSGDEKLRFHDITVYLAGDKADDYLAHIETVFEQRHRLPVAILDQPLADGNRAVEAVRLLLDLPLGRFRRSEMLALLTHPVFTERFDDADPKQWLDWVDKLGILFYADKRDLAETYIERDLYTWEQGLHRLTLGAWMAGARSGDERFYSLESPDEGSEPADKYLVEDYSGSEAASAGRLILMARSLLNDSRFLLQDENGERMLTLREWGVLLGRFLSTYLRGTDEDQNGLWRCIRKIQEACEADISHTPVPYRIAHEHAAKVINNLRKSGGRFLTHGVNISRLDSSRVVPRKVIFVLGLGEDSFPRKTPIDLLDLRNQQKQPGDIDARDQDRYAFLQAMLAAQERLYLSWVGRDVHTGEQTEPSSVIRELMYLLSTRYLDKDTVKQMPKVFPLSRHDERYFMEGAVFQTFDAEAFNEHRALVQRASLEKELDSKETFPTLEALEKRLNETGRKALQKTLQLPQQVEVGSEARETITISISALRKFLDCPAQGWAQYVLGMSDYDEEDMFEREHEELSLNALNQTITFRDSFIRGYPNTIPENYEAAFSILEMAAKAPTGIFANYAKDGHTEHLLKWLEMLEEHYADANGWYRYQFGPASHTDKRVRSLPEIELGSLELDGSIKKILLGGSTDPITALPDGTHAALLLKTSETQGTQDEWLAIYFNALILAAADIQSENTAFHSLLFSKKVMRRKQLQAIARAEAKKTLLSLTKSLLTEVHNYHIDADEIQKLVKNSFLKLNEKAQKEKRNELFQSWDGTPQGRNRYGPIQDWTNLPPPKVDVLTKIAERYQWAYPSAKEQGPQLKAKK